ncbi:MAG: ATP-binding cassette domain-containing protein [Phycisphaera sp.]|nr:ATP-binding cassette domain-containing protein [Phycisphaera sp.]
MIQLTDVYKSYTQGSAKIAALRGASITIDQPGYYAVMGASGSGKSTLLHLVAGLDKPDKGKVVVAGKDISGASEGALTEYRRSTVGIVFQQFNLIPTLTARQNVALPGVIASRPSRTELNKRVDELLDQLGIAARADHRPDALSGGEQQRVAIARALLFAPPVLLADEPTGNLDSASSEKLWTLLGSVAQQQRMTVLMVTHEAAAAAHCERVYVLGDGRTLGQFEVDGLDHTAVASRYQHLSRP